MDKLKICRVARGMTQKELARKSGVGITAIGLYENSHHTPNIYTAIALADTLGFTIKQLCGIDPITI